MQQLNNGNSKGEGWVGIERKEEKEAHPPPQHPQ